MLQQDDEAPAEAQILQDLTQVLEVSSDCEPPSSSQREGIFCNICNKQWKSYTDRNKHRIIHFEGRYICKYCGKKFKTPGNKNVHERSVHSGKISCCKLCGKRFKNFQYDKFRIHLIEKHTSYTCYTGQGSLEKVEAEMASSLATLEEAEEVIGKENILKMDADQMVELVDTQERAGY